MTLEINPRAFADWIRTGDGHPPLIGGKWFRYGPDQHGTNFHDLSPGRHTRQIGRASCRERVSSPV